MDVRFGSDRATEVKVRDVQFGDFLIVNYGTTYPIMGLAIYEENDYVFALSTQGVPWFLNRMKFSHYMGINNPQIRRYPPCIIDKGDIYVMNEYDEYDRRKRRIIEQYRSRELMTDLGDVLHYLLFRQYQMGQYREHLKGIFKEWYQQLGTFFSTPHQYLPLWIYNNPLMAQLCTDHHRYHPQDNIHTTSLATRIRNAVRQDPANLSNEQITYLNQFSVCDEAGIILPLAEKGWFDWLSSS
jgi:hypothetical protein